MKTLHVSLLLLSALSIAFNFRKEQTAPKIEPVNTKACSSGINQFSFDLLKHYAKGEEMDKNIFFSPFSIASAVSMTGEGAKGTTKQEILDVFHLPGSDSVRLNGFYGLNKSVNNPASGYKLNTSNALWIQEGMKLKPSFSKTSQNYYLASLQTVNFAVPEKACKTINDYVELKTENKITNLLSPGVVNASTQLVLTNTIYFKGDWKYEFNKNHTFKETFKNASGGTVQADMMHQTAQYKYFENKDLQALKLEYKDNEISMIIILPREGKIDGITSQVGQVLAGKFDYERTVLSFPKFTFETSYKLKKDLKQLGMKLAFSGGDLSGIGANLQIDEVIHKAFVEVAEKGTEAAAATAVVISTTSVAPRMAEPKTFKADHPFIFVIRHNATGAILFSGAVNAL